ncbi:YbaN family protein [Shewanella sp. NIFS-20-20]|uniref:YbaN family protein n=1 Tax=Shewanella sp. NIFS-20-20 TaxID=2853806 RepID=UPI001C496892|nr:YbaN family protein [Shewanella sp. NIFS-20-20]MBV7315149.1 YbaN family protein [Shewanella sp. NIFS-20-20]
MIFKRGLLLLVGLISLGLGFAGVFLPVLPTVPFILLSAFCFARSNERLHSWLMSHPWFAEGLQNWAQHRAMQPSLKRKAVIMSSLSFMISIYFVPLFWVKIFLLCCFSMLMLFLWRIPTLEES